MKHCWRSILYCAVLNEHCSYTPSANAIIINMLWVTISMKSSEIKNALTTKRKGSVLYIFNFPLCIRIVALSCSYFHNFMEFMFVDNVTFLRVSLVCWKICWCRYMTDFVTRASILNWIDQKKNIFYFYKSQTSSISAKDSPFSKRNRRQFGSNASKSVCGSWKIKKEKWNFGVKNSMTSSTERRIRPHASFRKVTTEKFSF